MNGTEDDGGFDPDEIEAIEKIMDAIIEEETVGYQMMFWVSLGAAKELVETYDRFMSGSNIDAVLCLAEFGKIVEQLREVMIDEEDI